MKSLKELYRIGAGPSSSHTMAPAHAAEKFKQLYPNAEKYCAILYGSLARTGVGHGTARAVVKELGENSEVVFNENEKAIPHPNTMDLVAYEQGRQTGCRRVISTGGGAYSFYGEEEKDVDIYPHRSLSEIIAWCGKHKKRFYEYVDTYEDKTIGAYMSAVWRQMKITIREGLSGTGELPGGLYVRRRASLLFDYKGGQETETVHESRIVSAYAFACAEQNAAGKTVVTAPTCGACGVIPAVLLYMQEKYGFSDEKICLSLKTAGVLGNLIKTNASISGAECGCQAEIGTACCMAAVALCELFEYSFESTECVAEMAVEHHLGLTCDPIGGLVQIPCIERNAIAALDAMNIFSLGKVLGSSHKIGFDFAVKTMYETGKDIAAAYRETAQGGLAKLYCIKKGDNNI